MVNKSGWDRYRMTLLARQITAEKISSVTTLAGTYDLRIKERIQLPASSSRCIAFSACGALSDPAALKADFLRLSSEQDMDIILQREEAFSCNYRLAVFDMDSTLIEEEVIDELAVEAGVGDQVAAITEQAMQGKIDFQESFRRRLVLLKGLEESALERVGQRLVLTEGAERLMQTLRMRGIKTAIVSGGFSWFASRLQQQLAMDYIYANELQIVDGRVTGEVRGSIIDGQRKADLLKEIAAREDIPLAQVIAVGDGANDLNMLAEAGLGIAFRAKPLVRHSAQHAISTLGLDAIVYLLA